MRYFLGFLASIGLIILVFILVLKGFGGHGSKTTQSPLSDYANTDTVMRMTVDGPIVSEQQHQAYRITVGQDQVTFETLQGYEYAPIQTKTYPNNPQAYQNFLRALDVQGYSKGDPKTTQDERGMCATGDRFVFQVSNGANDVERYWSASCGGMGNFKGKTQQVKQLFDHQIPTSDFSKYAGELHV